MLLTETKKKQLKKSNWKKLQRSSNEGVLPEGNAPLMAKISAVNAWRNIPSKVRNDTDRYSQNADKILIDSGC